MRLSRLLCGALFIALSFGVSGAFATGKVGVFDLQEVLTKSNVGKIAAKKIESKNAEFKEKFQAEKKALRELQVEIKKKSSVWSEDKRAAEVRDFQKAERAFKEKVADASFEMKQLRDKELLPIIEELRTIVPEYAKTNGYDVILERVPGVAYFNDSISVTPAIVKELDKKMSGK
ncbi:hypothetical protein CSB45_14915 [candidate division KSB3 bacterium]|uniref:Molecular chaperone Skp n=1 Tax=candidate division KSB3 bacterium TaxID=2044937 RepID=A0A2G6E0Q8_9BACT|nr:MAG: hypothetical protein CSB45_14915 [candidate division KSB3 bacterium]